MRYQIVLHKSNEVFAVSVLGLPGCWSQGATEQEAIDNIPEAIREYLIAVEDEAKGQDVREVEVAV
jgi:predicted RNase H-like HicB family nuclease